VDAVVGEVDLVRWTRSSVEYIWCGGHGFWWSRSGVVDVVAGGVDPMRPGRCCRRTASLVALMK
jgi:hypothetical protein